jgi:hypothetical protein
MVENKKFPIIIAGVILGLILLVAIFNNTPGKKLSKAIEAIPDNAGIIFETKDIGEFIESLKANKVLLDEAEKSESLKQLINEFNYAAELYETNKNFRKLLNGREFIISVHQTQQYEASKLFVSPMTKNDYNKLQKIFTRLYPKANITEIKKYDATIVKFTIPENTDYSFLISHYNDIFLMSFNNVLMQKSLRALKSTASMQKNEDFIEMSRLTGKTGHRIFINYENLPNVISKHLHNKTNTIDFIKNFAGITGLEIDINNNEIQLDGYTTAKNKNKYLNIFNKQKPGENNLLKRLPYYTSSFIIMNIGNGKDFKNKYEIHLSDFNKLKIYRRDLNNWYDNNQQGEKTDFFECISGELALVSLAKSADQDNMQLIFTQISDRKKCKDFLKANALSNDTSAYTITAGNKQFEAFPFNNNQFFSLAFGEVFTAANPKAAAMSDDYLIFAESGSELQSFLDDYVKKSPISENDFSRSFNRESNIFIYTDIYKSFPVYEKYLNEHGKEQISADKNFWRKISGPGIQFLADSDPIYTTLKIKPQLKSSGKLQSEWESSLDSPPVTKPFVVKNHNTGENEIFIQSQSNTVYLINNKGEILWKKIIDAPIISEVFQIDYYKNNKLQLLFNTENSIHLIDRNGNNTADYPIEFKHKATNGIAVFDYDNDKDYRIFFAAENKGIYALDKTGSTVNGWNFGRTDKPVKQSVQYFRYDGRDYICFFDDNKLYITNRRGEIRISPDADFPIAANTEIFFEEKTETSFPRFVLTDPAGSVYFVYLDGKVKRMKIETQSAEHYFMYADIAGNHYPEFIYADEKTVSAFNRNKEQVFKLNLPDNITHRLYTYRFSPSDLQLGIITGEANKVYLIDNKGEIQNGFPVYGNTPFSIRTFSGNEHFSLIAGNSSTKIISYRLYR